MITTLKKKLLDARDIYEKQKIINELFRYGCTIREIFKSNFFKFDKDEHRYYFREKELDSVTIFIGQFSKPFDSEFWSDRKARERGVEKEVILEEWLESGRFGTRVHSYIEDILAKKLNYDEIPNFSWNDNGEIERVHEWKKIYDSRLSELVLIDQEIKIYSNTLGLAGTIDALFFNKKKNIYVIGDWKTNKKITTDEDKSYGKLKGVFNKYKDNGLNKYSIQLSVYALILKEWGFLTSDNFICHMGPDAPAKIMFCKDFSQELEQYFEDRDEFLFPI